MGLVQKPKRTYAKIISDGSIRVQTEESNPNAVRRDFENPTTKQKGTKYELVYDELGGKIDAIEIYDGEYGKSLNITIDGVVLSMNMASNYAEDFMKKLPNVDLEKIILVTPYSFEDDKGKTRKGVTIKQDGEKITSFFYDQVKKKNTQGVPEPEGDVDKFDSDDWKMYYTKVRKFLQKYLEENIIPKLPEVDTSNMTMDDDPQMMAIKEAGFLGDKGEKEKEINADEVPF